LVDWNLLQITFGSNNGIFDELRLNISPPCVQVNAQIDQSAYFTPREGKIPLSVGLDRFA
jgi:hypothetical protein